MYPCMIQLYNLYYISSVIFHSVFVAKNDTIGYTVYVRKLSEVLKKYINGHIILKQSTIGDVSEPKVPKFIYLFIQV